MRKKITIRKADIRDAEGKGYVHYHSWIETYTGLMDQSYLDNRSLERCVTQAKKYPENTYVAIVDDKIVGFSCYNKSRDNDLENAGEVMAIYILKEYQGLGLGKKLMEVCFKELKTYRYINVWVLKSNKNTIGFYRHLGFQTDGKEKELRLTDTSSITVIRMILDTEKEV